MKHFRFNHEGVEHAFHVGETVTHPYFPIHGFISCECGEKHDIVKNYAHVKKMHGIFFNHNTSIFFDFHSGEVKLVPDGVILET